MKKLIVALALVVGVVGFEMYLRSIAPKKFSKEKILSGHREIYFLDKALGIERAHPGVRFSHKGGFNGNTAWDHIIEFDDFGRRKTVGGEDKKEHFVIAGGSMAFGHGVGDQETVASQVTKNSIYQGYNYGYPSYGVTSTLLRVDKGQLKKEVKESEGE